MEPLYSFTIPSIEDDTPLHCRIYHKTAETSNTSANPRFRSAVVAHPYAPLGGCYDDPVVMALTETLWSEGYVVVTFNFRGAGESAGRTSWTGNYEVLDYCSVVGLLFYYLQNLSEASPESDVLRPIMSVDNISPSATDIEHARPLEMLLGGYSFGALILARLPPISAIIQRFESAEQGTAASEIFLRARKLATQTMSTAQDIQSPRRGRNMHPSSPHEPRPKASPVTLGGEETKASDRRRSRDSKRSIDVVREALPRIKPHRRRHSGNHSDHSAENHRPTTRSSTQTPRHNLTTAYLLVSPVLLPLTSALCPPGFPFPHTAFHADSKHQPPSGLFSMQCPTFIIFGTADGFTSSKRLQQWSKRLCQQDSGLSRWERIEHAGHFWRERGVMQKLQASVAAWAMSLPA